MFGYKGKLNKLCQGMLKLGASAALVLALLVGTSARQVYAESFIAEAATSRAVASQLSNSDYNASCDLETPELVTTSSEGDQIKVKWSPVAGADQYRILLLSASEDTVEEELVDQGNQWEEVSACSYTFKKLESGSYRVAVMAVALEVDDWDYGLFHHSLISYSDFIEVEGYDFYLTSVKQTALNQVTVKWETFSEGDKLELLRSRSKKGDYELVKTISDPSASSATTRIPEIGKKYFYRMVAKNGDGQVIGSSDIRSIQPKVYKPEITAATNSATSIRISWEAFMPGLAGYELRYSTSEDGSFKLLKRITDPEKSSYLNSSLAVNETRYYKARVYTLDEEGKRVYSKYSKIVKAKAKLKQVKVTEVEAVSETSVYLAWNKVAGATGYQIWGKSSGDDSYKKLKTVSNNKDLCVCLTGLKDGSTYSFKVRAYKKKEDATYYGSYSAVKSLTLKKLAAPASVNQESKSAKCMRIFGRDEIVRYPNQEAAQKDMVKIQIKCWDFKDSSKTSKTTKTYTIEVHNKVASDVKEVFEEIYNGPEKFPIHDVIGYGWRGDGSSSEHNLGLAIDINPDENYFYNFSTDTILCGKYWKPGVDPYSIPEYGDVENAFNRHGFTRGRWSTKVDYMHFSFFGT